MGDQYIVTFDDGIDPDDLADFIIRLKGVKNIEIFDSGAAVQRLKTVRRYIDDAIYKYSDRDGGGGIQS